jgi:DNA repair protein RecO (recombination protein O)
MRLFFPRIPVLSALYFFRQEPYIPMHPEKLQAFVLSASDYGESDRIVSLFTLEHGRIKGFARAARSSRKRFGPALEPFARITLQLVRKDGLSSLRQADIITLHPAIRGSLPAIAHALYACELVESLTPEGQPLPRLYRLLATYLERQETEPASQSDRRLFEINLLNILGYRPSLEACSRCGSDYGDNGALMQANGGELVCHTCANRGRPIGISALRCLRDCLCTGRFGMVAFNDDDLLQVAAFLDEALPLHAGRRLKSLDFLRQSCS